MFDPSTMARRALDTPLMRQYLEIKSRYADALLFFRLGDFYEMFFDDAVVAARALDLTLTTRDKNKEDPTPMCGVPHHAAKPYVRRLLEMGHKVAICEQVEDPQMARGIVRREVTEVVTPGVLIDDDHLDARANNYLVTLDRDARGYGLAALDLSTFELRVAELGASSAVHDELARLRPKEIVCSPAAWDERPVRPESAAGLWAQGSEGLLDGDAAAAVVASKSGIATSDLPLDVDSSGLRAAALAIRYAEANQPARGVPSCRLVVYRPTDHLQLDEASLRNLDLLAGGMGGGRDGSLLAVLDETVTPMGGRLMRRMLTMPLIDVGHIRRRQDGVEVLVDGPQLRSELREALGRVADIERLTTRTVMGVATPRDLSRLGASLHQIPILRTALEEHATRMLSRELPDLMRWPADTMADLAERITAAIAEQPPTSSREGGIFRRGFHPEVDELAELADGGRQAIVQMERQLRERTGVGSLKVRYNRVLGYYIEVTKANVQHVPEDFLRKQTLVNAERYATPELAEHEARVLGAQQRRNALEERLFDELRREVAEQSSRLIALAERVALLDALGGLAEVAEAKGYTRPVVDDSWVIEIEQGRHPVVEGHLSAGEFVPNDVSLDRSSQGMLIVTGPNMAGKSTTIRQVALISLMAQMGSFVPCRSARIGVVDRVFTRVGASDNLARGESTFMVEMREAATILRHATSRSLLVLDEIGRGTSTYDGISIAWAVAEYVHDRVEARTMFATHYHELCQLAEVKPRVRNYSIGVREWRGNVVFLHKLVPGSSSRSYGIEVARLAGLPQPVIERAREVLAALEGEAMAEGLPLGGRTHPVDRPQLDLFAEAPAHCEPPSTSALEGELAAIEVDSLTPLEALNILSSLVDRARTDGAA